MQGKSDQAKFLRSTLRLIKVTHYQTLMQPRYAIKLFLCAYMCQICTAHQCGNNPMMVAKQKFELHGLDFENEVKHLPSDHKKYLTSEWRKYLDCISSVETGYFKRKRNYDDLPESFESLRSKSFEDVDSSLQSSRLHQAENQLFDQYDEAFKQLLRSDAQSREYDRDNINVMSELSRNTLDSPIVTNDDISLLVKRLLRYKLPKRIHVLNEEDFLDV